MNDTASRSSAIDLPGPVSFIHRFMLLAAVSGSSIALGRIASQLFAIHLGATPLQIGVMLGAEQAMMMSMAIPAGFLIARAGRRFSYFTASLGPMLVYLAMPFIAVWPWLVAARALIGLCIPFRMVSMNTAFLQQLPRIGKAKAGWYRGSQTVGLALVGPWLAAWVSTDMGYGVAFIASGIMFGVMGAASLNFFPEASGAPPPEEQQAPVLHELRTLLRNRTIFESCLIEHVSSATTTLFSSFILILAIKGLGLPRTGAVSLIAIQGCTTVASLFLLGRLFARFSRRGGYLWSLVAATGALLCLGFAGDYATLAAGAVLLSLASTSIHFQSMTLLSNSSANKSKASGLFNLASMSGNLVGSLGGGALSAIGSLQSIYLIWIVVPITAAILIALRSRRDDH